MSDIDRAHFAGRVAALRQETAAGTARRRHAGFGATMVLRTVPNHLGVDYNAHLLESFAAHVAPALGWEPATRAE